MGPERHDLRGGGRAGEVARRHAGADPHHHVEQGREDEEGGRRHDDVERERAHDAHADAHRQAEAEREHAEGREPDDPVQQHRDRRVDRSEHEHQGIPQFPANPAGAEGERHGEHDERHDGAVGGRPDRVRGHETRHPLRSGRPGRRACRRRRRAAQRRRRGRVDRQSREHRRHDQRGEGRGDGQERDEQQARPPARSADGAGIIVARDAHDELRDDERQDRHQDRVDPERAENLHRRADGQQGGVCRRCDRRARGQAGGKADEGLRPETQTCGSAPNHGGTRAGTMGPGYRLASAPLATGHSRPGL